jgi:hypothetical protein
MGREDTEGLIYHRDTENTEFRNRKNYKSETLCSLCLCGKLFLSVPSLPISVPLKSIILPYAQAT